MTPHAGRRWLLGALLVVALLAGASVPALAGDASAGKAVFEKSCAACHSLGGGDLVGPDLEGVADRRDADWVRQFILAPDEVIASGDAIAKELLAKYSTPMPNLGITATQADDLLSFLGFSGGTPTQPETTTATDTQPPAEPTGTSASGEHLFTGAERFASGGPSCLSCHSIAGIGALGGGQLGPDLTSSLERLGGATAVAAWLQAGGGPTMAPIYTRKGLTAAESADLVAFLADAQNAKRSTQGMWWLLLLAAGVAVALVALGAVLWRRRLTGVRGQLVHNATSRGK
ncbi:MAG: cytochrome c [Gaiellales bacterium]